MARYIDADALRQRMYHEAFETDTDMQKWDSGCWIRYKLFENCIDEMPTISPDEVRGVGKWEIDEQEVGGIFGGRQIVKIPCCSNCGTHNEWKTNYCPSCGARMKGAEDGTTDNS